MARQKTRYVPEKLLQIVLVALLWVLVPGEASLTGGSAVAGAQEPAAAQDTSEPSVDLPPPGKVAIPELPPEELPPATRAPPDPDEVQFQRFAVHVHFDEVIVPRLGDPYSPPVSLLGKYVAEYFRRAGHPVVAEDADPAFLIVGNMECAFLKELAFRGHTFALKFTGDGRLEVLDKDREVLVGASVPNLNGEGIVPPASDQGFESLPEDVKRDLANRRLRAPEAGEPEEANAVLDLRRQMASILWRAIYHKAGPLSDGVVSGLIDALTVDPLAEDLEAADIEAELEPLEESQARPAKADKEDAAGESGSPARAPSGDEIVAELVRHGFAAVPFLLEALTDGRPVLASLTYPGLTPLNAHELRVYHVADLALEEIFQKVSRMSLETPDRHRFVIIRGWENEWRRFCPSYRESPENPANTARKADGE